LNAYSAAAVCTPTRAAFMTGRYPARTPVGLYEPLKITPKDSLVGLEAKQTSLASLLQQAGYETVLVGKWHLGFLPRYSPNENGFDQFFGFHPGAIDYISHNINRKPALYENSQPLHKEGYITDLIGAKSAEFINGNHAKPFFLSIQFNAPHWPWQGPDDKPLPENLRFGPILREGGSTETFAIMMKSLDDAVGVVLKALEDAQLSESTIVIFTSDNGGEKFSDMGPYSGLKGQLKEGGIRVPAFVRWPSVITANTTTDQVAITMDWSATILEIAGANRDGKVKLDGINLLPVCTRKQKTIDRTFYWRTFQAQNQKAMRDAKWKYLKDESGEHLFDLSVDLGEKNDLKAKFPSKFEELKKKFVEWEKTVLVPVPM
jgi:arylsulfatase A-like enzyme